MSYEVCVNVLNLVCQVFHARADSARTWCRGRARASGRVAQTQSAAPDSAVARPAVALPVLPPCIRLPANSAGTLLLSSSLY